MAKDLQRTTFFIEVDLHRKLKAILALKGISITTWLKQKIQEEVGV